MATLRAHGEEVGRLVFEGEDVSQGVSGVDARRNTYAFMSDGTILKKEQVHFKEDTHKEAYWHDWGWHLSSKKDKGKLSLDEIKLKIERCYKEAQAKGKKVTWKTN